MTTEDTRLEAEAHEAKAIALDADADAQIAAEAAGWQVEEEESLRTARKLAALDPTHRAHVYTLDERINQGAKHAKVATMPAGPDIEDRILAQFGGGRWRVLVHRPDGTIAATLRLATAGPSLLVAAIENAQPGATAPTAGGNDLISRLESLGQRRAASEASTEVMPAWAKGIADELAELKAKRQAEPSPMEALQMRLFESMMTRQSQDEEAGGKQGSELNDLATNVEKLKSLQGIFGGDVPDGTPAWLPAVATLIESVGAPLVQAFIANQNAQTQAILGQQQRALPAPAGALPATAPPSPPAAAAAAAAPRPPAEEPTAEDQAEATIILNHVAELLAAESEEEIEEVTDTTVQLALLLLPEELLQHFEEAEPEQGGLMLGQLISSQLNTRPDLAKLVEHPEAQQRVEGLAAALRTALEEAGRNGLSVVEESEGQGDKEAAEQPAGDASGVAANEVAAETVTDAG